MRLKVSLYALFDYDKHLFDELELPSGADRNEIIYTLLYDTMDRDVLYTDPVFLRRAIGIWSRKKMEEWELLYHALRMEYDPIHAYKVDETRHEDVDMDHPRDIEGTTDVDSDVSAYNSTEFQPERQQKGKSTEKGSVADKGTRDEERHLSGNIGNLTPTALLKEYIDYRGNVCFTDIVVNDFITQFIRLVF